MSMRINHNISAINAHRQLLNNNKVQNKSLERLSSGLKINRAADGPAALVVSERLRAQTAGLKQAIDNTETGVSLMQTAEAALDEVDRSIINMRQLAVHAANAGVNDGFMLEANQQEITDALKTINRIASTTQYGKKAVLDGSMGANGVAMGDNLAYLDATHETKASGVGGYKIHITQAATRSEVTGSRALTKSLVDSGIQLTVSEGGRNISFTTMKGKSVESNLNALETMLKEAGMSVELLRPPSSETSANEPQLIRLRHKEYGSAHGFSVSSTVAGVLSKVGDTAQTIQNGMDVDGQIDGEEADGVGQVLTGQSGTKVSGLSVRYTGDKANMPGQHAGTVTVAQNSLIFQIGANERQTTRISLKSVTPKGLARGIPNASGFRSLYDIDVRDAEKAQDTIRFLDRALEEVTQERAKMGAFQKNQLESNLNYLKHAHENVTNAESIIRDTDMASEMANFTKSQILMQSSTAMLAQANQTPNTILSLLG